MPTHVIRRLAVAAFGAIVFLASMNGDEALAVATALVAIAWAIAWRED